MVPWAVGLTPHQMVRELVRREAQRWVISPCGRFGGRKTPRTKAIQWYLWEEDNLFGAWPDAKFVCNERRRCIMQCVYAELHGMGVDTSGQPRIKDVLSAHPDRSVEHALRDYIVQVIEQTVMERITE